MKLNLADDQLRLRMSEIDLERLLQEGRIDQNWACPDGSTAHCALTLTAMAPVSHCEGNLMNLRIDLPRTDFLAFAAERPRRDGFQFDCAGIGISIEVDVRDSHRRRPSPADI